MDVEHTEEFERWWHGLDLPQRELVDVAARVLARQGGTGRRAGIVPHASERPRVLRIERSGRAVEVLYRVDAQRRVVLLLEGRTL